MNDTLRVSCIQCFGNLDRQRQKSFGIQWPPRHAMCQRHPVQKLHGNERPALIRCDFIYGADVGVVQGRRGARLSAKAFERERVLCNILRQELQRDKATEFCVLGLVDHTHPATAELLDDAVVRDSLANRWRTSYVRQRD
jgi:hypothetical protein